MGGGDGMSDEGRPMTTKSIRPVCKITDCEKPVRRIASGLCSMHEKRLRTHGDVNYVTPREIWLTACREAQKKAAKPTSYRKLFGRHEHRVVAEQKIGRPLGRGEVVHHIDGDKHNNHPDNLLVISQADHLRVHHAEMWRARKIKYGYA